MKKYFRRQHIASYVKRSPQNAICKTYVFNLCRLHKKVQKNVQADITNHQQPSWHLMSISQKFPATLSDLISHITSWVSGCVHQLLPGPWQQGGREASASILLKGSCTMSWPHFPAIPQLEDVDLSNSLMQGHKTI